MNPIHSTLHSLRRVFLTAVCALAFLTPVHASYITASVNNASACGAINEPFLLCPAYTGPVLVSPGSAAYTDFGVNKVLASGTDSAHTEWKLNYALLGGTIGSLVNLTIDIAFDVNVIAANNSEAEFRMSLNNNTLFPFIIRNATNGLGNRCDDLAPGAPCLSGLHSGIWSQTFQATVGPNNRLYLNVQGSVSNGGTVDAFNTVTVSRIVVPDGITWQYDGIAGNPLNFQYASSSAVPEPAAVQLIAGGLLAAVLGRRRLRAH